MEVTESLKNGDNQFSTGRPTVGHPVDNTK